MPRTTCYRVDRQARIALIHFREANPSNSLRRLRSACRLAMSSRSAAEPQIAQCLERTEEDRQRRAAGSKPLHVRFSRPACRTFDESRDQARL